MKCNSIKVRQKDPNGLTGPYDLQGFKLVWNEISHCRLFIETLPLEMFWLEKMKLVKWQTLEWQEMCKNKIFMKGRQRFVLYLKLTYSIGLACNPFPLPRGKYVRFCWLCRYFLGFHALRVAPKTTAHEVKAVCVKLIKHLTILQNTYNHRSPKHGIRLHISGVYGCLSVVIIKTSFATDKFLIHMHRKEDYQLHTW